jgi:hypothetical protein
LPWAWAIGSSDGAVKEVVNDVIGVTKAVFVEEFIDRRRRHIGVAEKASGERCGECSGENVVGLLGEDGGNGLPSGWRGFSEGPDQVVGNVRRDKRLEFDGRCTSERVVASSVC